MEIFVDYSFFSLVVVSDGGVAPAPIDAWRTAKFGADAGQPAVAGDLADPDGDGLLNLLEYALGSDPRTGSATALPRAELTAGTLTMTYPRNAAATDVALTVESADALGAFGPASGFTTEESESLGGVRSVRVSFPANQGAQFVRLRVTRL